MTISTIMHDFTTVIWAYTAIQPTSLLVNIEIALATTLALKWVWATLVWIAKRLIKIDAILNRFAIHFALVVRQLIRTTLESMLRHL